MDNRLLRKFMGWVVVVGMGGATFQLSGCDETIRTGIITSLGSASATLLTGLNTALFTSLLNAGQPDDTGVPTTGDLGGGGGAAGGGA